MKLPIQFTLAMGVSMFWLLASSTLAQTAGTGAPDAATLKYGLYIHYGMPTFAAPGQQGQIPMDQFDPGSVNVKAWAQAAKAAGMTFAVLTAKHESGFCLWDSAGYSYDIAKSPYQGDVIGDFIAACKAEGILPGVLYAMGDALNDGPVHFRGPISDTYFAVIKKHLTELNTRYPDLRILVISGQGRLSKEQFEETSQLVKQLNPQCLMLNDSDQEDRGPREADGTVVHGWFWNPNVQLNTSTSLYDRYKQAQAAGQIFILNVGPKQSGRIPDDQLAALAKVKELIDQGKVPITAESLMRGLILHYDFNQEPVAGRITDLSGSGNDGMVVNVQWTPDGHRGGSVQFGKDNSYITVRNNDSLNPAQMTLCAWIKTAYTDSVWRRIFDKGTWIGYDLTMSGDNKGKSFQGMFALEAGKNASRSRAKVADGNWHLVVGTFDETELRVYVDGQLAGGPQSVGNQPVHTDYDLTIGANRSNPNAAIGEVGASFNGWMDDVMMFNRALTSKEVKFLYASQKTAADEPLAIPAPRAPGPPASAPPAQNKPTAAQRLKQVKDLYDQGLITKDQYDQKVREIMNSL